MRSLIASAAVFLGLSLVGAGPVGADGQPGTLPTGSPPALQPGETPTGAQTSAAPKAPAAPMILNMLSRPIESQEAAFRESIRQAARSGEPGPGDGTIRIGGATLSIVVKDPCPDGEPYHDVALVQRPRPGRTRR